MTGTEIGRVRELVRYPVKSMAGEAVESAVVGWHGLAGDRRFAFRRLDHHSGFPWLSASRVPELLSYRPICVDGTSGEPHTTHVQAPDGSRLALGSPELNERISASLGGPVELMHLEHGIFDEAAVSVISMATIAAIGREAGIRVDRRRFRANIVLETARTEPFLEDGWVGGRPVIGDGVRRVVLHVTLRDRRCAMINLDPDTCEKDARVMKAVARLNENDAGVYATVVGTGTMHVGDRVTFAAETSEGA